MPLPRFRRPPSLPPGAQPLAPPPDPIPPAPRLRALDSASVAEATAALKEARATDAAFLNGETTAGNPAITIPPGLGAAARPVGVTLGGQRGGDARLPAFADAVERLTEERVTPALSRAPRGRRRLRVVDSDGAGGWLPSLSARQRRG